jgi:SAM-dependent methyltransferase
VTEQTAHRRGGSSDRFGYEWNAYAEILPEHEAQFRGWTIHLSPQDWRGESCLDVGCGMGRNSYWPMTYGARDGCAVDIDDRSLASARRNLARFPTMRVERSSAYDLPFADRFDIAFAIGVIHHLEEPERALRRMARAVKWRASADQGLWSRGQPLAVRAVNLLRRAFFSRMPIALVHHLSLYPAALLWLLLKLGLRPIEYFRLLARFRFAHLRAIVFDQMLPRIAHYWPRETVMALMVAAGLEDIRIAAVNEMSWSTIGRRPLRHDETARS